MLLLDDTGKPTAALLELACRLGVLHEESAVSINAALQEKWYRPGKLRAEISEEYAKRRTELMPLFSRLGLVDAVLPPGGSYDYALLLGATVSTVRKRLRLLREQEAQGRIRFKWLVLLGSERLLRPDKESAEVVLKPGELPFKKGWDYHGLFPKTEASMMVLVRLQSDLPEWPTTTVSTPLQRTPDGRTRNPNTEDTVRHWLRTRPNPGRCLAVSSQPFVSFQRIIVENVLRDDALWLVEACGYEAPDSLPVSVFLDTIAKQLYEEVRRLA